MGDNQGGFAAYTGYVDAHYLELAAQVGRRDKERTWAMMQIAAGQRVLDVGCGPGLDTVAMAALVGPTGSVAGVDHDPAMVAAADARAEAAGIAEWTLHQVAEAARLPFAADSFDACRSERLFQHLPQPEQALAEMIRVTRHGGLVVVMDTDYSTLTIDSRETDIERRLARYTTERLHSGYVARHLYGMFRRAGLLDVSVEVSPQAFLRYPLARLGWLDEVERQALATGIVTEEALARWRADLEGAGQVDAFFASLNHILVVGRKAF
jgi:ubiquinone/menaquinone biosynthesis C-methylase UbiE